MQGVIFNIYEEFLRDEFDHDVADIIMFQTDLETQGAMTDIGSYPDGDLMTLVAKTCDLTDTALPQLLRRLGKYSFAALARRYPVYTDRFNSSKDLLLNVGSMIHTEVERFHKGAYLPTFTYEDISDNELIIHYKSKRRMKDFMYGMIEGVGKYYRQALDIEMFGDNPDEPEYCGFRVIIK